MKCEVVNVNSRRRFRGSGDGGTFTVVILIICFEIPLVSNTDTFYRDVVCTNSKSINHLAFGYSDENNTVHT